MPAPVIVIFGVTGDLSKRKLLPALYHLLSQGMLPKNTKIIGVSRHPLNPDELLGSVELCVLEKDKVCDPEAIKQMRSSLLGFQLNPENPADYQKLRKLIESISGGSSPLLYMSVPPKVYGTMIEHMANAGLNAAGTRLLIEKPFGFDLGSAEELIDITSKHFTESQIYRIDHYLAKETAQNLLTFRLHNPIFTPIWNSEHIERVHIRAFESIDIEGRVSFYEQTGALRDLVQSHLMQLLSITLMDLPPDMTSGAIHLTKQYFMEQLQPADPALAVRGQYEGYTDEVGNPESSTETYTKVVLRHTTERWHATEIILETGKGLSEKVTDISIEFRLPGERRKNILKFRIQPNEGIELDLVVKEPGFENSMRKASLNFEYNTEFKTDQHIDAYERVLMDAIRGDQSLFASDHEVLASWRVLQPVLDAWRLGEDKPMLYPKGSTGSGVSN